MKRPGARRRRPAALTRIAVAGLSATGMFTIVSLLAVRANEAQVLNAAVAPATPTSTLPPRQVVIYITDQPTDSSAPDAPADTAAGEPVDGGGAAEGGYDPGSGSDTSSGGFAATPAAAPTAPTAAPSAPAAAPVPAPAPAPSTGTGGS